MAMAQAADMHPRKDVMGGDFRKLYDLVRTVSASLQSDRPLADEIGQVMELLQSAAAQKQCLAPDATR
jgi:histidine ammonia-lyase